jgi:uncharacterized RDD family membrane protein YckC
MFCTKCGAEMASEASFCQGCGARVADTGVNAATFTTVADSGHPATVTAAARSTGDVARYAGFWRRVAASVLDGLIQAGLSIAVLIVAMLALDPGPSGDDLNPVAVGVYYVASWVIGWLYFALMHSSARQATIGKRAMGIKVVSLEGARITFARATGRYFAYLLSGMLLGIGYLMAAFTARKQGLHDMMVSTLVVSRDATAEEIASGLAAPRVSGGVIALAAVAGLVPILGILAAIAVPAYQDYVIRAQVAEGLTMAAVQQAAVVEAWTESGDFSVIDSESLGIPVASGRYVEAVEVMQGAVAITFGGEAHNLIQGKSILLVPGFNAANEVFWTCGLAGIPEDVTPALNAHTQYTDVPPKFLPSSCRQ